MSANLMRVDELAGVPLSFPAYAGILTLVAADAARRLNLTRGCQADQAAFPGQPVAGRADGRFVTAGK
jgi:hypothetical protein